MGESGDVAFVVAGIRQTGRVGLRVTAVKSLVVRLVNLSIVVFTPTFVPRTRGGRLHVSKEDTAV